MLAIERIMGVFFEKRKTSFAIMAGSYLLYFALTSIAFLLWNIPIISFSLSMSTMLLITFNYEATIKKRIVAALGTFTVIIIADALAFILSGFYQTDIFDTVGADSVFGMIILGAVSYIVALLVRRFKYIRKNTINAPMYFVFNSVILVSTAVMVPIVGAYLPHSIAVIAIVVIFGITICTFYLHDALSAAYEDKLKSALHAQEKEYYFTQCKLMQESVENIRTIRHDMKMHLATARDFSISGKADATTDYLNGLLGDIEKKEIYSNTNNTAFDSIINFKLNDTKQENIKLDIRILIPPILNIEVADIVTILGNLLDNAIDAVATVEDKQIKLDIEYSKESLFIQIENTFDGGVKYAKGKDGRAEAITTRKSGNNHGYGLKNIRKSVEKYNGHVDTNHEGSVFSVGVLLYIDDM